jgi:hypothetical protein
MREMRFGTLVICYLENGIPRFPRMHRSSLTRLSLSAAKVKNSADFFGFSAAGEEFEDLTKVSIEPSPAVVAGNPTACGGKSASDHGMRCLRPRSGPFFAHFRPRTSNGTCALRLGDHHQRIDTHLGYRN